jgi:hypothetical protein
LTKPLSPLREVVLKAAGPIVLADQQRGSTMVALIFNPIYRKFLKAVVPGMARQWVWR